MIDSILESLRWWRETSNMSKPFDPNAELFNVQTIVGKNQYNESQWVTIFDCLPKEDAEARKADLLRRPLCDPASVRIIPIHYQG